MKSELIFSGIGGQGTILMGKMACAAAAKKGYNVTLSPATDRKKEAAEQAVRLLFPKKWAQ